MLSRFLATIRYSDRSINKSASIIATFQRYSHTPSRFFDLMAAAPTLRQRVHGMLFCHKDMRLVDETELPYYEIQTGIPVESHESTVDHIAELLLHGWSLTGLNCSDRTLTPTLVKAIRGFYTGYPLQLTLNAKDIIERELKRPNAMIEEDES